MDSPEPVDLEGFEFSQQNPGSSGSNSPSQSGDGSYGRISMYVSLFDEMIKTVLESEEYLFTEHECNVLRYLLELSYPSRYLLVRLLLRSPTRIHTFPSLEQAYGSEIGPDLDEAMETLTQVLSFAPTPAEASSTPRTAGWEAMNSGLTPDEEKADPELAKAIKMSLYATSKAGQNAEAGPSRPPLHRVVTEDDTFVVRQLCRSQDEMAPEDIMACMSVEELKKVAKLRKVNVNGLIRRQVIQALLASAKTQSLLSFAAIEGGTPPRDLASTGRSTSDPAKSMILSKAGVTIEKSKPKGAQQTQLYFPKGRQSVESPSETTPPPRMRPNVVRAKAMTPKLMLMSQLMPYLSDRAISLLPPIVRLVSRLNLVFSRTLASSSQSQSALLLPSILVTSNKRRYPTYTPTRSRVWESREQLLSYERAISLEREVEDSLGDSFQTGASAIISGGGMHRGWKPGMLSRKEGAVKVREIWETVWPEWQTLVIEESAKGSSDERRGVLDRFTTGHVLTRIIYKGAAALGILHEYDKECEVLRALLAQRRWRRGKRGAWYDRLALILMNHYGGDVEKKENAVEVCIDGLMNEETHLIYRPGLSRRLTRLEKQLALPADERHICDAELKKCFTRTLAAPRAKENAGIAKGRAKSTDGTAFEDETEDRRATPAQVGRSVWHGREGEVSVEGWVLEWWEKKGYKGFHAESSILTTLFGLLMWPVIFQPLHGAFETPYQTAPLDLGEDTFATARRQQVEERLAEMATTAGALKMLHETDDREREKATWAVGIRWDYGRDDLEDIVESMGGRALSVICRMLCEEYRHRASGVPDLIVWHPELKLVRFVEVKGPGDSLSQTQKIWIDVLLSAGVDVEVCRVEEASLTAEAPDRKPLRKRNSDGKSKVKASNKIRPTRSRQYDQEDEPDETDEEDGGGDADEFRYESGDEGKKVGGWERRDSPTVINLISSDTETPVKRRRV